MWYEEVPLMDLSLEMQEFKPLTSAKSLSTTAYEMKCQAASQHELWERTFDLLLHYLYKLQGNKTWWPFQAFFLDLYRQGCLSFGSSHSQRGQYWTSVEVGGVFFPPKVGTSWVLPEAVLIEARSSVHESERVNRAVYADRCERT